MVIASAMMVSTTGANDEVKVGVGRASTRGRRDRKSMKTPSIWYRMHSMIAMWNNWWLKR